MKSEDNMVFLLCCIFFLIFIGPLWYFEITGPEVPAHFSKPVRAAICGMEVFMAPKKPTSPAPRYLKKITTKHVGLATSQMESIAKKAFDKADGAAEVAVLRVYGRARTATQGQGQYGPWTKFGGEFEAKNLVNGEVFRSTHLCVPPMGEQMLNDMLDCREDKEAWVQFGFDVTVSYNDTSAGGTKFAYGVQPLLEQTTPKDDILTQLGASLPAPKALLP
jgi:hypothetical protein